MAWNAIDNSPGKESVHFESDDNGGEVRDNDWIGFPSTMFMGVPTGSDPWWEYDTTNNIIFKKFLLVIGQVLCLIILVTTVQFIPVACVSPL